MSILTATMKERGKDSPDMFPPCCGLEPFVYVWPKAKMRAIHCSNPECSNHEGVAEYLNENGTRWEKFRVKA
jgi:hypothetical protein